MMPSSTARDDVYVFNIAPVAYETYTPPIELSGDTEVVVLGQSSLMDRVVLARDLREGQRIMLDRQGGPMTYRICAIRPKTSFWERL